MTIDYRVCSGCGSIIPPGSVYHCVRLVIQGEQDVAPDAAPSEGPGDVLTRMETEGDWSRYAHDVHWERQAELCTHCRDLLRVVAEPFLITEA